MWHFMQQLTHDALKNTAEDACMQKSQENLANLTFNVVVW